MTHSQIRAMLASGQIPVIAGGAGETYTNYSNVLKEYYPAQGLVNQVFAETYLLFGETFNLGRSLDLPWVQ